MQALERSQTGQVPLAQLSGNVVRRRAHDDPVSRIAPILRPHPPGGRLLQSEP